MKKFFSYIFILIVLLGVFAPSGVVRAETEQEKYNKCADDILKNGGNNFAPCGKDPSEKDKPSNPDWFERQMNSVISGIGYVVLSICGFILWLGAQMLDFSISFSVVDFAEKISKMKGINVGWKITRDLMNIAFIFILMYQSIMLIISQENVDKIKKFVGMLILASLLINFSLFFTKIIIDASNIVTIGIYNSILGPDGVTQKKGLSTPIMSATGISGTYNQGMLDSIKASGNNDFGKILTIYLMSSVLFIILAFVFFAVSIMFFIRYVAFIILMMTAPVGFMGMALGGNIKGIGSYSDEWWTTLQNQCIWPPVYMFMMLLVLTLISADGFVNNSANRPSIISSVSGSDATKAPDPSTVGVLINYGLIIGLSIAALTIAKSTATKGSKMMGDALGKATAFAGGAVMGGTAAIGRNTLGRAGNALANNEALKERASKSGFGGAVSRFALKTSDKAAKSSMDIRATEYVGNKLVKSTLGLDLGKVDPKKTNFQASLKAKEEKAEATAKLLAPSADRTAEAKARDEQSKKDAEIKIKSDEFKAAEAQRKEDYFNSDEWKNSENGKKEAEAIKAREEYAAAQANINEQRKKMADLIKQKESVSDKEEARRIQEEINTINSDVESKKKRIENLKILRDEKEKLAKDAKTRRDEWKSKEMEDEAKIMTDGIGEEKKLKKIHQDRIDAYAESFEKESKISMYTKNILKVGLAGTAGGIIAGPLGAAAGVAYGTSFSKTSGDNRAIARKIKSVIKKDKPKSQKEIMKLLKDNFGFDVPEEEKDGEKKDDKPKEESKTDGAKN